MYSASTSLVVESCSDSSFIFMRASSSCIRRISLSSSDIGPPNSPPSKIDARIWNPLLMVLAAFLNLFREEDSPVVLWFSPCVVTEASSAGCCAASAASASASSSACPCSLSSGSSGAITTSIASEPQAEGVDPRPSASAMGLRFFFFLEGFSAVSADLPLLVSTAVFSFARAVAVAGGTFVAPLGGEPLGGEVRPLSFSFGGDVLPGPGRDFGGDASEPLSLPLPLAPVPPPRPATTLAALSFQPDSRPRLPWGAGAPLASLAAAGALPPPSESLWSGPWWLWCACFEAS
mmetsp:Transcript_15456/g.36510  ORF Transcript_15456/g.36510 Transcript_15456/m.36510 type:complete len:291 (-) Transcript_15456:2690-3562(-)